MELTREQTEKILEIAGIHKEYSSVVADDITKAIIKIEDMLSCLIDSEDIDSSEAKILIVDDLELSTYQLTAFGKSTDSA